MSSTTFPASTHASALVAPAESYVLRYTRSRLWCGDVITSPEARLLIRMSARYAADWVLLALYRYAVTVTARYAATPTGSGPRLAARGASVSTAGAAPNCNRQTDRSYGSAFGPPVTSGGCFGSPADSVS